MKKNIFIIDDDDFCSHNLKRTLGATFNVMYEADALLGLKIIEEQLPDIILLDVVMPIMSGYDVCKSLKKISVLNIYPLFLFRRLLILLTV